MITDRPISAIPDRGAPFIPTKLIPPPIRSDIILRPHLLQHLDSSLAGILTILSAPAGFGKTTLLAAWIAHKLHTDSEFRAGSISLAELALQIAAQATACAWLSLDAEDNDPSRFWRYVLAALHRALPDLPADLSAPLRATPPTIERVVMRLADTLAAVPRDVVLVLDEYHTIADPVIHQSLAALLEYRPPRLHVVIAAETDPPLPLDQFHMRDRTVTLRAADLRFSPAEAALFLRRRMGITLSSDIVAQLVAVTEGRAAALQLAALRLQADPDADPAAHSKAERHLIARLTEEVIAQQPAEIQRFLLDTAILDRMCSDLCDELTTEARQSTGVTSIITRSSQELLVEIERANLFLAPLEPDGVWFGYHPIFRAALCRELPRRRGPQAAADLHRRAAAWLVAASDRFPELLETAIRHAFTTHDYDFTADVLLTRCDQLVTQGRIGEVLDWISALPEATLAARPALALRYAWVLFLHGRRDEAVHRLAAVEHDPQLQSDRLNAALPAVIRAAIATDRHNAAGALHYADQAIGLLPPEETLWTTTIAIAQGLAYLLRGEVRTAATMLQRAAGLAERTGHSAHVMRANWYLGQTYLEMGHLADAELAFQRIGADGEALYAGYRNLGLAAIAYERDEPKTAYALAHKALDELEVTAGQARMRIFGHHLLARLAHNTGDEPSATTHLEYAEALAHHPDLIAELALTRALRASFAIAKGDPAAGREWALAARLDPDRPNLQREQELLVLIQLLIVHGRTNAALRILTTIHKHAAAQGRVRTLITSELLRVQALTQLQQHASAGTLHTVVVNHATETGLLRLSREADHLLGPMNARTVGETSQPETYPHIKPSGYEPLSPREREVIALIAAGCSNHEIAATMIVSVNTVKTHIKRIYEKLHVNNRSAAVARVRQLSMHHKEDV